MNPEAKRKHAEPDDSAAVSHPATIADAARESESSTKPDSGIAGSYDAAIRTIVEQKIDEIGDDELSLVEAIGNLIAKKGEVPQDIASPLCPLYIHKLRMIGASYKVKKDAVWDYVVATARDVFWSVNDISQACIDMYFHELTGMYHRASQGSHWDGCSNAEAQEIGLRVFNETMAQATSLKMNKCGSGAATNRGMLLKISNEDYEELEDDVNWHPFYDQEMNENA